VVLAARPQRRVRRFVRSGVAALALTLGVAAVTAAGSGVARAYSFKQIASGFGGAVHITSAPGDASTLYVVEQPGVIELLRSGRHAGTFLDISKQVLSEGEHGLLSIAFHPGYAQNHLFYIDYTDLHGDTRIVEFRSENGVAVPASAREILFVAQPYPNHKGGQLAFDRRGLLYVGMGDGGTNPDGGPTSVGDPENRAQDPNSLLGKLLRIDPTAPGARWEAIAYGLRNPWRFSFDRLTGDLWIGDVGAARFEEIDYRRAAKIGTLANYGWSRYEGGRSYNNRLPVPTAGELVFPLWYYGHGPADCGVIGGYVYRGKRVAAARGRYFYGDLCNGIVRSFKAGKPVRDAGIATLQTRIVNISSFGEDGNGELYAVSVNGGVYALR
jgi:glucose/arabinose dehydrogenase